MLRIFPLALVAGIAGFATLSLSSSATATDKFGNAARLDRQPVEYAMSAAAERRHRMIEESMRSQSGAQPRAPERRQPEQRQPERRQFDAQQFDDRRDTRRRGYEQRDYGAERGYRRGNRGWSDERPRPYGYR